MGFSISWMAFHGLTKEEVLARTDLRDTGEEDEMNASPVSGTDLADGWYLIFGDDPGYIDEHNMYKASAGCRVVSYQVDEGVMCSVASCYEDGERLWSVAHDADQDEYHLDIDGAPPGEFSAIRDRFTAEQKGAGPDAGVDLMHEIPAETAMSVCGYRYDLDAFDWGAPAFTRLEPA